MKGVFHFSFAREKEEEGGGQCNNSDLETKFKLAQSEDMASNKAIIIIKKWVEQLAPII